MKYRLSQFRDFLRTPFPYLILALCLFMAWTLLSNPGFRNALQGQNGGSRAADRYQLCLVCSGPGSEDALSDIGFTAANFILFPVTAVVSVAIAQISKAAAFGSAATYAVYLSSTVLYGLMLPFLIFLAYSGLEGGNKSRTRMPSVYSG